MRFLARDDHDGRRPVERDRPVPRGPLVRHQRWARDARAERWLFVAFAVVTVVTVVTVVAVVAALLSAGFAATS